MFAISKLYAFALTLTLLSPHQVAANPDAQKLFQQLNVSAVGKAKMTDDKFVAYVTTNSSNRPALVFEIHPHANVNKTGKVHTATAVTKFHSKTPCFKATLGQNAFKGDMSYFNGAKVNACNQIGRTQGERYIAVKARRDNGWRLGLLR